MTAIAQVHAEAPDVGLGQPDERGRGTLVAVPGRESGQGDLVEVGGHDRPDRAMLGASDPGLVRVRLRWPGIDAPPLRTARPGSHRPPHGRCSRPHTRTARSERTRSCFTTSALSLCSYAGPVPPANPGTVTPKSGDVGAATVRRQACLEVAVHRRRAEKSTDCICCALGGVPDILTQVGTWDGEVEGDYADTHILVPKKRRSRGHVAATPGYLLPSHEVGCHCCRDDDVGTGRAKCQGHGCCGRR